MLIDIRMVSSLGEYFKCISRLAEDGNKSANSPKILWFRGIGDIYHPLIPSLFRTNTRVNRGNRHKGDYSQMHYAEDIRTQHYAAKNEHFLKNKPTSRVEWLEIMQHHEMKTRLLDWSESSVHSLLFAIEPYINNKSYSPYQRNILVPCVWVLEPGQLNKQIFCYIYNILQEKDKDTTAFSKKKELINLLLGDLDVRKNPKTVKEIENNLKYFSEFSIYQESKETRHMDYILDLNTINDEILREGNRLKKLLIEESRINLYHYIVNRIYSDGHILSDRELPPLAIINPYHSERIKAQHGVFTIFPFYEEKREDQDSRDMGINPDAMEKNKIAGQCLHKIIINNPRKIAFELMENGMSDSWLYPEMPIVSGEIENHRIY